MYQIVNVTTLFHFVNVVKQRVNDANNGDEHMLKLRVLNVSYITLIPIPKDDAGQNIL